MYRKPSIVVWSLAIVSVAFTAAALVHFLGQTEEGARGDALLLLLLLGFAAVTAIWRLVRGYRTANAVPDISQLTIGAIIRPQRRKALAVALILLAVGAALVYMLPAPTPVVRWSAWGCVVVGAVLLVLIAAGVVPIGQLELREEGLVFAAGRAPLVLPWERIRAVEGGEFGGNPAFFLWLDDPETLPVPPAKRRGFLRAVAYSRAMMECDYYHITTSYGVGLVSIVAAIDHHRARRQAAPGRTG